MIKRLAIIETHPIQYKIPWFRQLHDRHDLDLTVFFCMIPDAKQQGVGFGVAFQWDFPLLEGYSYEVIENVSRNPGVDHFMGCDTPCLYDIIAGRHGHGRWDAVIINGWVVKSCLQALWACKRAGVPAILRCEANDLRSRVWWKTWVHRLLVSQFESWIAIGSSNRAFYVNRGVPDRKIANGYYCVDSRDFARKADEARGDLSILRHRWGIHEQAVCFMFCGKFEPKKRPMDILMALKILCREKGMDSPRVHLLMVGDGELKPGCEKMAGDEDLPVTFTGFLNQGELPMAYAVSHCLVLPSDYGETWGLVVNEAMACGLPAIVSDRVGCHPDLIIEGKTGYVFPFGSVDGLVKKIEWCIEDKKKVVQMGTFARHHILPYSINNLTLGTLSALGL